MKDTVPVRVCTDRDMIEVIQVDTALDSKGPWLKYVETTSSNHHHVGHRLGTTGGGGGDNPEGLDNAGVLFQDPPSHPAC